jgi:NAD(P)-dependent dehydrogenase (short-subunit alcohol dehydrogenase family)
MRHAVVVILVANAGVSKAATIDDTTVEDFDRLFAINVRAPNAWSACPGGSRNARSASAICCGDRERLWCKRGAWVGYADALNRERSAYGQAGEPG